MAFGFNTWDEVGVSVGSTLSPYNLVGSVNLELGTHTFDTGGATGSIEYWITYGHPFASSTLGLEITSISISGSIITYTVEDAGTGDVFNKGRASFVVSRG